ncbi:MAG TPA: hypothetical protein VIC58_01775 [Actinomycetota bacterium]|jgi:hypothetical protein
MTTADVVKERALWLARSEPDGDAALRDLESCAGGRRVAAVRARQQVEAELDDGPDRDSSLRAIQLLDELVVRLPA